MNVNPLILDALRNDLQFEFKENESYYQYGKCPDCDRKTVYISKEKPGRLACSHNDSCGYAETTRDRYTFIFENLSRSYPATADDPNATAKAYMSQVRGFPLNKIESWFTQGSLPLKNKIVAPTVRFNLWDGFYWERLINADDIRVWGAKNHNKKGLRYSDKCWCPPGLKIEAGDTVFIVEGIFHAIALSLCGYKVVAALASGNLPRELIETNKDKAITWALAYDNDENNAGKKAAIKFRNELRGIGQEKSLIYQCPKGKDWDDIYREGKLDQKFMADCLHRGRVNTAESLEEKAYCLYTRRQYKLKVIDYGNRFHSINVEKFGDEISEAIAEISKYDKYKDHELYKADFSAALLTDKGKEIFYQCLDSYLISNCYPQFLYAQVDTLAGEIGYNFSVSYPHNTATRLITLSGSALESPATFNKALLNQSPGATFDGTANQLKRIRDNWFAYKLKIVDSVQFIGYDKESGIYIFPDFAFYQGRLLKPNKSGYVIAGKHNIKTTLKSIPVALQRGFTADWIDDYFTAFHYNGLVMMGFFLGSLFAEQIRKAIGFMPFLELTGEAGTGKTTQIEFCQKLIGRDQTEGFNPSKASFAARSRAFSQLANMPLVLIEGDSRDGGKDAKKGKYDYTELKDLFNGGHIRSTGVFNRGNDINAPLFRASIVIAQNASVDGDEAILTRIVHLHSTRAHHKRESKSIADRFRRISVKEVAGFLSLALDREKQIFETIIDQYKQIEERFSKNEKIQRARILECHALVAAMVVALKIVIPKLSDQLIQESENYLLIRAEDRQRRLDADHPLVASFWEIYDLLNLQAIKRGEERRDELPGVERETLNHSQKSEYIAINLQEFRAAAELAHFERIDTSELKKLLPGSQQHKFLEIKTVNSQITGKAKYCWVFKKSASQGGYQ